MILDEKKELPWSFAQAVGFSESSTQSRWKSIYMDREGGLSITMSGLLNEEQVKFVLMHFMDIIDGDSQPDDPEYFMDYKFLDEDTLVFTPDGYNYKEEANKELIDTTSFFEWVDEQFNMMAS